jgi:hypothetical protein
MTRDTAKSVIAARKSVDHWKDVSKELLYRVSIQTSVKERHAQVVQFLIFLQGTREVWKTYPVFVKAVRDKLSHFRRIDKWEHASYFENVLLPRHA